MANDSKKKQSKKKGVELPAWINKEDWDAFVKMRIKIKKPLSDRAKELALKALYRLKQKGQNPNLALQFAEYQCNQGVFPVPKWYYEMMGIPFKTEEKKYGDF